jgi:hypothetical protein
MFTVSMMRPSPPASTSARHLASTFTVLSCTYISVEESRWSSYGTASTSTGHVR